MIQEQPPVVINVKPQDYQVDAEAEQEMLKGLQAEQQSAEQTLAEPTVQAPVQQNGRVSPNASMIQQALNEGYTGDEIKSFLVSNGLNEDDADLEIIDSVKGKILEAKGAGYSDDEVLNFMVDSGYDGDIVRRSLNAAQVSDEYKRLDYRPEQEDVERATDIADLYSNIYGKYSTTAKQIYGVFDFDTAIEARKEVNQLNRAIVEKLKSENIDAFINDENGEVMMRDANGNISEVESSFLNGMWNSKGELAGAIAGGLRGATYGARLGAVAGPTGAVVGATVGGIAGSMLGAGAGKGVDLAINAKLLSEELTAKLYMTQMKEAGIFDGALTVLGGTALKLGAASYKGMVKAYKYVTSGNTRGAYKALKDNLNITDEQADAMVAEFEKLNNVKLEGSRKEKAISVVSQTVKGGEVAVKSAAAQNERVATMLTESIDNRAKAINKTIDSVADENTGAIVRKELNEYETDVKSFFGLVKKQAADVIDGTDFRFDLDKLAIKPVMDNIEKKLSTPNMREQFIGHATRIANASQDRTFSGLVELRSAVNDFKYTKNLKPQDMEALNVVINKIDTQIGKAVKTYMPDGAGKEWVGNFAKAKSEYSKMKQLQENSLYRLINRPGMTEDGIQKAISKYSSKKDVDTEVFNKVVTRLSPATKAKVEAAAVKNLTSKYTYGEASDFQAVHFPALAQSLKELNISTPEAKGLLNVVDEIAKVYKNDIELSGITAKTLGVRMQSNLSADLSSKVKYTVIGAVWNSIQKFLPGQNARNIALIDKLGKLFENPLSARSAEDLIRLVPKESKEEMTSLVKQLQIETAKKGGVAPKQTIRMYRQSKTGNLATTDGMFGKGIYLVDKVAKPSSELKVAAKEVEVSKLADLEAISKLVGKTVTEKDLRQIPNLQQKLIDKGYLGIKSNNRAMLFPETTTGTKLKGKK